MNIERENELQQIVSIASKTLGKPQKQLRSGMYEEFWIIKNPSHPP